jgi:hypothetical protein
VKIFDDPAFAGGHSELNRRHQEVVSSLFSILNSHGILLQNIHRFVGQDPSLCFIPSDRR